MLALGEQYDNNLKGICVIAGELSLCYTWKVIYSVEEQDMSYFALLNIREYRKTGN